MPYTSNRNWYYPAQGTRPYFTDIQTTFNNQDVDVQALWDAVGDVSGTSLFEEGTGASSSLRKDSSNLAGGDYDFVSGFSNTTGTSASANGIFGKYNTINFVENSLFVGMSHYSTSQVSNCIILGKQVSSEVSSSITASGGHPTGNTVAGQAQIISHISHSAETSDGTPTRLYIDGNDASIDFVTADNNSYILETLVIARCRAGDSSLGTKSWKIYTTVQNVNGIATIIGSPDIFILDQTAIGHESIDWDIVPSIYNDNILSFEVTGHTNDTVRWMCASSCAEIGVA